MSTTRNAAQQRFFFLLAFSVFLASIETEMSPQSRTPGNNFIFFLAQRRACLNQRLKYVHHAAGFSLGFQCVLA